MLRKISTFVISYNSFQRITYKPFYQFGKITNFVKGMLQSVIKQQHRSFEVKDMTKQTKIVPKNQKEAQKQYIQAQQTISSYQQNRMKKIDQALGTRTYYHQTKIYEERLDSDHIMEISQLKKKYSQTSRQDLDWSNPQSPPKLKIKNKRKHSKFMKKLRSYPSHQAQLSKLEDQTNSGTLDFLGKQTLFTKLSLASVEGTLASLESEEISFDEQPLFTNKYAYFRAPYASTMYRIHKERYFSQLSTNLNTFIQNEKQCQQVISLQYLYQILKEYDTDSRVSQYLKKVQNGKIDYILNDIIFNQTEDQAMMILDLMGDDRQFCAIYKNFKRNEAIQIKEGNKNVVFNIKPKAFFQGTNFYYIQRSEEGLYVQLAIWNCQTKQQSILYQCKPFQQLEILSDFKKNFIFIKQKQISGSQNQKVYILDTYNPDQIKLCALLPAEKCVYKFGTNQAGVLFVKFWGTQKLELKFGSNNLYANELYLIPYKAFKGIMTQQQKNKQNNSQKLQSLPQFSMKNKISADNLDINAIKSIYKCQETQYIKSFEVRKTHIILNLSKQSIFNKNKLYFIPQNTNAFSHSLYLQGYSYQLDKRDTLYESQMIKFVLETPLLPTAYKYTIWKKQLEEVIEDNIHAQTIFIQSQKNPNLHIRVLCHKNFVKQKTTVVLYCSSIGQKIHQIALRKFLMKGIMVVQFFGRGTPAKDAQYFMEGTGSNYKNYVQDLQKVLTFIGNNLSQNISIYTKGPYSSLILFLMNLKFPGLFNCSVLHNGFYDFKDNLEIQKCQKFFGYDEQSKNLWRSLDPLELSYSQYDSDRKKLEFGYLEDIMISSDPKSRIHSRKLILKIRRNKNQKYGQVYLKQHENDEYKIDAFNLSYIYQKIRQSNYWQKQSQSQSKSQQQSQ